MTTHAEGMSEGEAEGAPTRDKPAAAPNQGQAARLRPRPEGGTCARFIAHGYQPLTIGTFLPRCYPTARRYARWMRQRLREALRRSAVSLGRQAHMQGRPMLWAWSTKRGLEYVQNAHGDELQLIEADTLLPKQIGDSQK